MSSKPWSDLEISTLTKIWPTATRSDLLEALPGRSFDSSRHKAKSLGLGARESRNNNQAKWAREAVEALAQGRTLSKELTDRLAQQLEANGIEISRQEDRSVKRTHKLENISGDGVSHSFGLISCTHFGSRWQQATALKNFYQECSKRGIDNIFHAGDLTDGAVSMHRGFEYGLHAHGADAQRDYTIEHYPKVPGITTHVISGNHDLSFKKESGFNIVKAVCNHREDMVYGGDWVADYNLPGNLKLRLRHGRGGGSYAMSYKLQKIIGSLNLHEDPPDIYGVGHYHKAIFLPDCQGVAALLLPAFQGMTPFAKSLTNVAQSFIGGWIISYQVGHDGQKVPWSTKAEFIRFPELQDDY